MPPHGVAGCCGLCSACCKADEEYEFLRVATKNKKLEVGRHVSHPTCTSLVIDVPNLIVLSQEPLYHYSWWLNNGEPQPIPRVWTCAPGLNGTAEKN